MPEFTYSTGISELGIQQDTRQVKTLAVINPVFQYRKNDVFTQVLRLNQEFSDDLLNTVCIPWFECDFFPSKIYIKFDCHCGSARRWHL